MADSFSNQQLQEVADLICAKLIDDYGVDGVIIFQLRRDSKGYTCIHTARGEMPDTIVQLVTRATKEMMEGQELHEQGKPN